MLDHEDFDKVWNFLNDAAEAMDGLTEDENEAVELIIAGLQPSGWSPEAMFAREDEQAER